MHELGNQTIVSTEIGNELEIGGVEGMRHCNKILVLKGGPYRPMLEVQSFLFI